MSQRQTKHSSNVLSNEEDGRYRRSWIIGSKCLIHSEVNNKWMIGEIISIINDNEGEWLNVKYIINKEIFCKPIQRFSRYIKPIFNNININNKRTKLINIEKTTIIESLFDVLNHIQINILIKIINKKIKVKNNQQRQETITEEKYNEQEEQDILTIIKREKGDLFHTKTNDFSSNCVERIKFILSMYNIWLLNNENNNHIKKNKNLSFHDIIENYFDNTYKYVNFVIDYRNITNIKKHLFERAENQSNICNANTNTKSNIQINNIQISDTEDDDIIICEYKHNNITYSNNINDKSNNDNLQIKITKPTNNKLNKRRKKSVSTSKSGHSHLSNNNNNNNHLVTPNMRIISNQNINNENSNQNISAMSSLSAFTPSVMSSMSSLSSVLSSLLSSSSTMSISNSNPHEGNNSSDNSGESSIDSMDRDIGINSGDSSEMNLNCKTLSTKSKIDNNKIGFLKPNEFSELLANYHANVTSSIGNDKNNIAIKKTAKQFAAIQEKLLYIQQQNNKIIKPSLKHNHINKSSNPKLKVIHSNHYDSNAMSDIDINNIIIQNASTNNSNSSSGSSVSNSSSNSSSSNSSSSSSSSCDDSDDTDTDNKSTTICNDTQCSCNTSDTDDNTSNSITSSRESSVSSSSESTVSGNSSQTSSDTDLSQNTGHSKINKSFHNRKKTNKNNDTQIQLLFNDDEGEQYKSFKTLVIHDNYVD